MKILHTLFFLSLIALSACKKGENTFVLKGTIHDLTNDTLLLYNEYDADGKIDTLIAKDGKFHYEAQLDTLTPYTLLINGETTYPIYADKSIQIRLSGTATDPYSLKAEGGEDNDDLNRFRQSIREQDEKEQTEAAKQFILNNPHAFCNLHLIETYFLKQDSIPYKQLNELIESMDGKVQDAFYTRRINERIKRHASLNLTYVPSFNLRDGKKLITASTYFQKVYIIHFWASWNSTSPATTQLLKRIYKQYKKEKSFDMLSVSFDLDEDKWQKAIQTDSLEWKQIRVEEGFHSPIAHNFGIEQLPSYFLIDTKRKIVAINPTEEELEAKLKQALEEIRKTTNKKK